VEILLAPMVALFLIFHTRAPALAAAGLVALAGVWLVRWRERGHPTHCTPLNLALLLLLLTVPVAAWASAVSDLTTDALAYLLAGIVLFRAVANWTRTPVHVWWIWGGLVAAALALAVLAPLGISFSPSLFAIPAVYMRWAGRLPETIHPNVIGAALVVLGPIAAAGLEFRASGLNSHVSRFASHVVRVGAALTSLLLIATLALTQSRGAYVGTAVSLLVLLSLRRPKAARVAVPLVMAAALVGASLVGWDRVADELTTGDVTSGLDSRLEIWSRALYAIQDFPFTGLGFGTFEQVVSVLYPLFLSPAGTVPHAHNLFLQVAVDLGLPGLIAYLAILGLTFASAFSSYNALRRRSDDGLAGLCAGCIAALAGMCVLGLVDVANWGIKLAFIPWVVIGLVVGLHRVAGETGGERGKRENGKGKHAGNEEAVDRL
jgi:putative inorganic carbon (HCO3(-)) transporter